MRKNTLNFIVDLLALLAMLVMIATGLLIKYVLPPRHGTGAARTLADMDRHAWGEIHFWAAVVLGALVVLHIVLHWKWVCVTTQGLFRRAPGERPSPSTGARGVYGLVLLGTTVMVVGGFLWLASVNVRISRQEQDSAERLRRGQVIDKGGQPGEARRGADDALRIRGSMTLGEVAQAAGIPVNELRAALNLPETVSPDERLGHLRRDFGLEMSAVREAVQRLQDQLNQRP